VARAEARQVFITDGVNDGESVVTTTLDAPIPGTRLLLRGEEFMNQPAVADSEAEVGENR